MEDNERLKRFLDDGDESILEAAKENQEEEKEDKEKEKEKEKEEDQEKQQVERKGKKEEKGKIESSAEVCSECRDQPADKYCLDCEEGFCEVCFFAIHRTGKRKEHRTKELKEPAQQEKKVESNEVEEMQTSQASEDMDEDDDDDDEREAGNESKPQNPDPDSFLERAKYIPLRLGYEERKDLRLVEAALNVSEYTDKVDNLAFASKAKRTHAQLRDICAVLCGLVLSLDFQKGQELLQTRDFAHYEQFFQGIFEVGRRYKIMNPERMRADYGKLIYLLQDSQVPEIQNLLQFQIICPVNTVYRTLEAHNALDLLRDPFMINATKEILADGKSRSEIQAEIKQKERSIESLAKRYAKGKLSPDEIKTCLYSIGDNNSFLRTSRDTIDKMIDYLKTYFNPEVPEENYSLAIQHGVDGARLSHSHARQYAFVLQSLSLWREISHDMFKLWIMAEEDLLDQEHPYELKDTGQGLNRVQQSPRVSREMHSLLYRTQKKLGDWVGSSVIHLGDNNVPNGFIFIDKYTQVPRILNPILLTLNKIEELIKDPNMKVYVDEAFGGKGALRKEILSDFFRHAFDGSGADNFFDAGSCIDGRLTSAWNWCSSIEKKRYFPIFLLTDFVGFDGKF